MITTGKLSSRIPHIAMAIFAFVFCWAAHDCVAQQSKPDVSGSWKLNRARSKFPSWHGPGDFLVIKHSEPRISIRYMARETGGSETNYYTTDEKERIVRPSDRYGQLRAKAHWDGNTLVIDSRRESQDLRVTVWVSRYELSEDGKILVVVQHWTKHPPQGPFEELLTYERQR